MQPSNASTPAEPIAALHEGSSTLVRNGKLYAATMTYVKCQARALTISGAIKNESCATGGIHQHRVRTASGSDRTVGLRIPDSGLGI